jgi:hypothetical protein
LEYITAIWYILGQSGNLMVIWYIFPVLVYCVKTNLATLLKTRKKAGKPTFQQKIAIVSHPSRKKIENVFLASTPKNDFWAKAKWTLAG